MSARMRRLQNDLADLPDVRFVSFTVDPDNDTPEVLTEYAKRFQARAGRWYFLTGPMEDLNRLCRETFLLGDVKGKLDHSTRFVLVDRHGVVRGYYVSADNEDMRKLDADIRSLARSSS
jgi:protein SCO1/2